MFEPGTILRQVTLSNGDIFWRVTRVLPDGRVYIRNGTDDEVGVTLNWLRRYCTVHALPSVEPPCGSGEMYARVRCNGQLTGRLGPEDGSSATMIEWILATCEAIPGDENATIDWWAYDPNLSDDPEPDMTATWSRADGLVWSEA